MAASERGVWFWLNRYSICTPHFNRKDELILFRGAGNRFCPQILMEPSPQRVHDQRCALVEGTRPVVGTGLGLQHAGIRQTTAILRPGLRKQS